MVVHVTDFDLFDQYRPPGRSNRSGRAQNDNDVFEGLPVKQWGQQISHISLAPPKSEEAIKENDKWGEPPMPRDYQLLLPWTQHLLRLARSGKVGTKRKPDPDTDDDKPEDELNEEAKANLEERGYVAKKWKPVPEALLEPEHKHFEFLAKRRKGLPSLYGPDLTNGAPVPMRKAKVQRTNAESEVVVYEVLVPEGASLEGEITAAPEGEEVKPAQVAPGTVIEGLGTANEEGVLVAEHLKPAVAAPPRRNRPPPKRKAGPGRGKKRVTFTNPDGSTYTTVVPNATKIVPQPGQIVKHVAKGEEAMADITAEQAAAWRKEKGEGEEGEEGSDDGGDEGDDDDDDGREEGEVSEDEGVQSTANATPVPTEKKAEVEKAEATTEDVKMEDAPPAADEPAEEPAEEAPKPRDASSSPELPLAKASHSRQNSQHTSQAAPETDNQTAEEDGAVPTVEAVTDEPAPVETEKVETFEDGEEDLLGSLEKSLDGGDGGGDNGDDGGS
jgi:hypothetical protein